MFSEEALRPKTLSEFVGQPKVIKKLRVYIEAARKRGEPLDHVLFHGPPGVGKTTLASAIAHELGVRFFPTSGVSLDRVADVASILVNLSDGDVFFIDEIHRLPKPVEEALYSAMEDFHVDIVVGKGAGARTYRLNLPRFTLIGATTRLGLLSGPFRARFGIIERLDFYPEHEIVRIIERAARILGIEMDSESMREIARRSRGTPRVAIRLLKRVRDFAEVGDHSVVSAEVARKALDFLEIDGNGLEPLDRLYLKTLVVKFGGGPVGIASLATAIGEAPETLEDFCEPYLIRQGFLKRTPRGRVATSKAFNYVNHEQNQV